MSSVDTIRTRPAMAWITELSVADNATAPPAVIVAFLIVAMIPSDVAALKIDGCGLRRPVDLRPPVVDTKYEIRFQTDNGVTAAHRAALNRFQEKAHGPRTGNLEKSRDRRFQIGDERGPYDLRLARRVTRCERLSRRLEVHLFSIRGGAAARLRECRSIHRRAKIVFEPGHVLAR